MNSLKDEINLVQYFPNVLLADRSWFRKITTSPHILAHVNTEYPVDCYPELKIYISELIICSYENISVAYVKCIA
jgi:hypothetical protein